MVAGPGNGWRRVSLPYAFRAIGYRVATGEERRLVVAIAPDIRPGVHRLRKRIQPLATAGGPLAGEPADPASFEITAEVSISA